MLMPVPATTSLASKRMQITASSAATSAPAAIAAASPTQGLPA